MTEEQRLRKQECRARGQKCIVSGWSTVGLALTDVPRHDGGRYAQSSKLSFSWRASMACFRIPADNRIVTLDDTAIVISVQGNFLYSVISDSKTLCAQLALDVQKARGKKLKDFQAGLADSSDITTLRQEVEDWAEQFPLPGFTK